MKTTTTNPDLSLLPCLQLSGVGKRIAERLARLGIHCVQDLLFHLPSRYQDRTRIHPIRDLIPQDHVVIEAFITGVAMPKIGRTRLLLELRDASGRMHVRFFYVNAAQRQTLIPGVQIRCYGEVRRGTNGLEMIHPEYYILTPDVLIPVEENLTPIYPATEGVSQPMLRKLTTRALEFLKNGGVLRDILPEKILQQFTFPALSEALQFVHRPPTDAPVECLLQGQHVTQKRLVFEELLAHRLSLLHLKNAFQTQAAIPLQNQTPLLNKFLKSLPFQLTAAQNRVVEEIEKDLIRPHPMQRLVQGDVGSGKTVVAAYAMLRAIENNFQAAVLAPTELLAEQHFQTFKKWLEPLGISVMILTGQMKTSEKNAALKALAEGEAAIIVGTHALFQKGVTFQKLALVVVDEQHRFGVEQRAMLRQKGVKEDCYPHQLIMTATPIPRTLAMSVYADLDYSIIDEMPPGRTPVTTSVISNSRRNEILERISDACSSGKQAYWVCTLIEESENLQCKAAEDTARELQIALPKIKMALIHGRLKAKEKEQIMAAFKQGEIQLLVATTVIEVGVDVPNATLMIIENAERLGLAQLHQLRGRVGRGSIASHCVLLYQNPLSDLAKKRLAVLRETNDGFKISQRDLELRGPGEVLGTRQTGDVSFKIANLLRDSDLLPAVQQAATILQNEHPDLVAPLIKRWLADGEKFGHV